MLERFSDFKRNINIMNHIGGVPELSAEASFIELSDVGRVRCQVHIQWSYDRGLVKIIHSQCCQRVGSGRRRGLVPAEADIIIVGH